MGVPSSARHSSRYRLRRRGSNAAPEDAPELAHQSRRGGRHGLAGLVLILVQPAQGPVHLRGRGRAGRGHGICHTVGCDGVVVVAADREFATVMVCGAADVTAPVTGSFAFAVSVSVASGRPQREYEFSTNPLSTWAAVKVMLFPLNVRPSRCAGDRLVLRQARDVHGHAVVGIGR